MGKKAANESGRKCETMKELLKISPYFLKDSEIDWVYDTLAGMSQ